MNKHFGPLRDDFQRVCWFIYGDSFGSLTSQSNGNGVVQEVRPLEDCENLLWFRGNAQFRTTSKASRKLVSQPVIEHGR